MISWREDWRRACLNRRVGGKAADKATKACEAMAKCVQVSHKAERQRIRISSSSSGVSSNSGNSSGSAAAWQHGSMAAWQHMNRVINGDGGEVVDVGSHSRYRPPGRSVTARWKPLGPDSAGGTDHGVQF